MKATHIVAVQSGWVFVGTKPDAANQPTSGVLTILNAACVRRWGTTMGLGELALSGPTKETILELCGTVDIAAPAVLFSIPVDPAKWKS